MNAQAPADGTAAVDAVAARAAAQALVAVRRGGSRLAGLPAGLAPATLPQAYAVQAEVLAQLGTRRGGWKATLFAPGNGICAPLAADAIMASPARLQAAAQPTRAPALPTAPALRIEPEVAFRMARDLPPRADGGEHALDEVLAAVGSAHAVLELVASRYRDENAVTLLERVADAFMNEGMVVGPACADWRRLPIASLPITLRIAGTERHRASGGHPIGDPLVPLLWIANHLSALGIGLAAGEIVTTGSWAGAPVLVAGQEAEVEFGGLGSARLRYD